jgi:hypothetical protein
MADQTLTDQINVYLIPILVALGFVLNTLTIMVFCRRRMRKYCMSVSMIYLALSDMLVLLVPVFFTWIDDNYFSSWLLNNSAWCNLHGYADLVFSANSSWTIIVISLERWFAVWRPWQKAKQFTNKRMKITIAALFLLSTLMFAYFPLSLRVARIEDPAQNHVYYINNVTWVHTSECKIDYERIYYFMGTMSVLAVYVAPFFILAILNIMIIIKLRQRPFSSTRVRYSRPVVTTVGGGTANELNKSTVTGLAAIVNNVVVPPLSYGTDSSTIATTLLNQTTLCTTTPPSSNGASGEVVNEHHKHVTLTLPVASATVSHLQLLSQDNQPVVETTTLKHVTNEQTFKRNVQRTYTSKADQNLSITLVTVAVTFMALTFPYQAYWFYDFLVSNRAGGEYTDTEINLRNLTFIFKNTNYVINFFLYSALSKLFRAEFFALIVDDKFGFCIGSCMKLLIEDKTPNGRRRDNAQRKQRLRGNLRGVSGDGNGCGGDGGGVYIKDSSFAEINFSMDTIKKLKSGDFTNARYISVKIEPSHLITYFRRLNETNASARGRRLNAQQARALKMKLRSKQQVYGDSSAALAGDGTGEAIAPARDIASEPFLYDIDFDFSFEGDKKKKESVGGRAVDATPVVVAVDSNNAEAFLSAKSSTATQEHESRESKGVRFSPNLSQLRRVDTEPHKFDDKKCRSEHDVGRAVVVRQYVEHKPKQGLSLKK